MVTFTFNKQNSNILLSIKPNIMIEPPRRYNMMEMSQAEKQLFVSALEIEKLGDDSRLQQAQTLIAKARELVADYVDEDSNRKDEYVQKILSLSVDANKEWFLSCKK